ncbi:MAG: TetR/AcrR family transcriptional regulator [Flavobacterium psychrophilum]|nr:MAG: TetR/AcrR family transcriptional regulator [Flavobacterium psychrophilum]
MPRNKEFNYDEKLVAARDLFWKKGYNATSINDLEVAMKINRSSIYLAYGNKHELFVKSLCNYMEGKDRQYREAAAKSNEPLQAIRNIILSVRDSAVEDKTCLFTNSVFELASSDVEIGKLLKRQTQSAVSLFESLLVKAKDNGSYTSVKTPAEMALFLVSGLVSIYNTQVVFSDRKLTNQTAEILMQSVN